MEDNTTVDTHQEVHLPVLDGLEGRLLLKCEVCGEPAIGSACSSTGPVSFAYCSDCLRENREPYSALVAFAMGVERLDQIADWYQPIVLSNLKAEGKTLEEFFGDTKRAGEDYEKYQEEEHNGLD